MESLECQRHVHQAEIDCIVAGYLMFCCGAGAVKVESWTTCGWVGGQGVDHRQGYVDTDFHQRPANRLMSRLQLLVLSGTRGSRDKRGTCSVSWTAL